MRTFLIGVVSIAFSMSMFSVSPEKAAFFTIMMKGLLAMSLTIALCFAYDAVFGDEAY